MRVFFRSSTYINSKVFGEAVFLINENINGKYVYKRQAEELAETDDDDIFAGSVTFVMGALTVARKQMENVFDRVKRLNMDIVNNVSG